MIPQYRGPQQHAVLAQHNVYNNQSFLGYAQPAGSFYMREVRQSFRAPNYSAYGMNRCGSFAIPASGANEYPLLNGSFKNGYCGSYMNSMNGFGSMYGGGWCGEDEPPPVVYKLFSSRREKGSLVSQHSLNCISQHSLIRPGYGSMLGFPSASHKLHDTEPFAVSNTDVCAKERVSPAAAVVVVSENVNKAPTSALSGDTSKGHSVTPSTLEGRGNVAGRTGTSAPAKTNVEEKDPKTVEPEAKKGLGAGAVSNALKNADNDAQKATEGKEEDGRQLRRNERSGSPAIPISRDVNEAVHKPARVGSAFGDGEKNKETTNASKGPIRQHSRSSRRRSPFRTRTTSAVNMSIPEIPVANELQDTLDGDIIQRRRSFGAETVKTQRRRSSIEHVERRQQEGSKISETVIGGEGRSGQQSSLDRKTRNVAEGELRVKKLADQYSVVDNRTSTNAPSGGTGGIGHDLSVEAVKRKATHSTGKGNEHENEQQGGGKSNPVKTLVVVERHPSASSHISVVNDAFTFDGVTHNANEIVHREAGSTSYHSKLLIEVKDAVCNGYNASIISVEAPGTGGVFRSPVWSGLSRVVRGVLQRNQDSAGCVVELTAALGFIHKDKVRDLFDEKRTNFETLQVHPSPIYGPRIPQLRYGKITSAIAFEEAVENALSRASNDVVLSSTDGVVVALLLSKQSRVITNESGEKTCDVLLSSLVVASTGSDVMPFESALSRTKNEYSMIFHLVLGGPCHTCFMLNLSMRVGSSDKAVVEKLIALQDKMHLFNNYPLRSGSVTRFVKYVESANLEGRERLKQEENPEKRSKLERYVQEQERLLMDANKMLKDANEEFRSQLSKRT